MINQDVLFNLNSAIAEARSKGIELTTFSIPEGAFSLTESERARIVKFVSETLSRHDKSLLDYIDDSLVGVDLQGNIIAGEGAYGFKPQAAEFAPASKEQINQEFLGKDVNGIDLSHLPAFSSNNTPSATPAVDSKYGAALVSENSYVFNGFGSATSQSELDALLRQNKLVEISTANELDVVKNHLSDNGAAFKLQSSCDNKSAMATVTGAISDGTSPLIYLSPKGDGSPPEIAPIRPDMVIVEFDGKHYLGSKHPEWDLTPTDKVKDSVLEGLGRSRLTSVSDLSPNGKKDEIEKENENTQSKGRGLLNFGNFGVPSIKKIADVAFKPPQPGAATSKYLNEQLKNAAEALATIKSMDSFDPSSPAVKQLRDSVNNIGGTFKGFGKDMANLTANPEITEFLKNFETFQSDLRSYSAGLKDKGSAILDFGKDILSGEALKTMNDAIAVAAERLAKVIGSALSR